MAGNSVNDSGESHQWPLREQYKRRLLEIHEEFITDKLEPSHILPNLHLEYIDEDAIRSLEKNSTSKEAAKLLLQQILEKWQPGCFEEFINALAESGSYEVIVEKLDDDCDYEQIKYFGAETSDASGQDPHRLTTSSTTDEILTKFMQLMHSDIIRSLHPKPICTTLYEWEFLDDQDKQSIIRTLETRSVHEATWELLRNMRRHKAGWYSAFLEALYLNEDFELMKRIDPDFVVGTDKSEKMAKINLRVVENGAYSDTPDEGVIPGSSQNDVNMDDVTTAMQNLSLANGVNNLQNTDSTNLQNANSTEPGGMAETNFVGNNFDDNSDDVTAIKMKHGERSQEGTGQTNTLAAENHSRNNSPAHGSAGNATIAQSATPVTTIYDRNTERQKTEASSQMVTNNNLSNDEDDKMLPLRDYQKELAKKPLQGINTIICAPTGCGKTRVSLHIAWRHLEAAPKGERKIIFMAKTQPLAEQQYRTFSAFLQEKCKYRVQLAVGGDEHSHLLHLLYTEKDVIVCTPQIMENHFQEGQIDCISKFSLIIFDECHHTTKDDPYNCIMHRYRKLKLDNGKASRKVKLPQVVGLTASLGVGKSTNDYKAETHILNIMANMDCAEIAKVQQYADQLSQHVNIPKYAAHHVPGRKVDPFYDETIKIMQNIERKIRDSDVYLYMESKDLKPPGDRTSQMYEAWAVKGAKESSTAIPTDDKDDRELSRMVKACFDHLREYWSALDINHHARTQDAVEYLKNKLKQQVEGKKKFDETDKELFKLRKDLIKEIAQHEEHINPKLEKLKELIKTTFEEKGPSSRGIVFVKTRASTIALHDWMKEDADLKLYAPERFTGAGAKEEEGGITQTDQEEIITKFRSGICRTLIATSVAEEGLDIPECNVVIRYNYVTNEIAMVQARGRSRKAEGETHLLGDFKVVEKDNINILRESMMERAIDAIMRMEKHHIENFIYQVQAEDKFKRETKELLQEQLKKRQEEGVFTLKCLKCKTEAVKTNHLRIAASKHHFVVDETFRERIDIRPIKKPKKYDNIEEKGKIHCKKCDQRWGIYVKYSEQSFPVLSIAVFLICYPEGREEQPTTAKKWLEAPFAVAELTLEDQGKKLNWPAREASRMQQAQPVENPE